MTTDSKRAFHSQHKEAALLSGILLAGAFASSPSLAGGNELAAICKNKANSREAAICLADAVYAEKAELEKTIVSVRAKARFDSNPQLASAFDTSQRRWNDSVQATCHGLVEAQFSGGTIAEPESYRCELSMTADRNKSLQAIFRSALKN